MKDELRSIITPGDAHEIRNLLNLIMLNIELGRKQVVLKRIDELVAFIYERTVKASP